MNWIKVTERLPDEFESVIVWGLLEVEGDPHHCHEAYHNGDRWDTVRELYELIQVTHWMPWPAGPGEA